MRYITVDRTSKLLAEIRYNPNITDGLRKSTISIVPAILVGYILGVSYGVSMFYGGWITRMAYSPTTPLRRDIYMVFSAICISLVSLFCIKLYAWPEIVCFLIIFALTFCLSMLSVYGVAGSNFSFSIIFVLFYMMSIKELASESIQVEHVKIIAVGALFYALIINLLDRYWPVFDKKWAIYTMIEQLAICLRLRIDKVGSKTYYKHLMAEEVKLIEKQGLVRAILHEELKHRVDEEILLLESIMLECVNLVTDYESLDDLKNEEEKEVILLYAKYLGHIANYIKGREPLYAIENRDVSGYSISTINMQNRIMAMHSQIAGVDYRTRDMLEIEQILRFRIDSNWHIKAIVESISWGSDIFRNSIKVTIALLTIFVAGKIFADPHTSWAYITAILVIKPQYSATINKGWQRINGNVIGVVAATALLMLFHNEVIEIIAIIISVYIAACTQNTKPYPYYAGLRAFAIITLQGVGKLFNPVVAIHRLLNVSAGVVIALVLNDMILDNVHKSFDNNIRQFIKVSLEYLSNISDYVKGASDGFAYRWSRKEVHATMCKIYSAWLQLDVRHKHHKYFIEQHADAVVSIREISICLAKLAELAWNKKNHWDEECIESITFIIGSDLNNAKQMRLSKQYNESEIGITLNRLYAELMTIKKESDVNQM